MDVDVPFWSFRGQVNSEWGLQSSLNRILQKNSIIDENIASKIEKTLWRHFNSNYRNYPELKDIKFDERQFVEFWMSMQHYGCPTRMLDWSDSPFIALYYAVESHYDKDGAVFLFNNHILQNESENRFGRITYLDSFFLQDESISPLLPVFHTKRSYNQQGVFTLSRSILLDHSQLITNLLKGKITEKGSPYCKLIIAKEYKMSILDGLRRFNVRPSILYPDAFGLGREIQNIAELRSYQFARTGL